MKPTHWLLLGSLVTCASAPLACSSDFRSCFDTRTCAAGGKGGASDAGSAGEVEEAGGAAAGSKSDAGAAGEPPGEGGMAGASVDACEGVNLDIDPKNCGSCGHDCLGGECELGRCQRKTIASQDGYPIAITTDGTFVYWVGVYDDSFTKAFVARRRIDATDKTLVIASDEERASDIATIGGDVYWVGLTHIRTCSTADCVGGARDYVGTSSRCLYVNGLGSQLFFSCNSNYRKNDGALYSAVIPNLSTKRMEPTSGNPERMVVAGDSLYWVNPSGFNDQDALGSDGAVWRMKLKTGATTRLVGGLTAQVGRIAVGASTLYFTTPEAIFRVPLPNGTTEPTVVSDDPGTAFGLVADERSVYWTDCTKGLVERCAHAGCEIPEIVAPDQGCPRDLAQDSAALYWIEMAHAPGPGFSIQRLAK